MTTTNQAVVLLDEEGAENPDLAGTKAATLARLAARGFPVPAGFVITVPACDRIAAAAEADAASELPSDVWADVLAGLARLGNGALAVRSSAGAEDLAGASYAGQYETVLGVSGAAALAAAIRTCVESGGAERVRAYARASAGPVRMAVLVQRLVPADAAGVAFSANPVTGDPEVLISAITGLGDRLVSGEVTPDEWVARGEDITCARSANNALDASQAARVAALARQVADHAGVPQDIEWAIAGDELFLVQARPITALPTPPEIEVPAVGFWEKDSAHYPTPLTPFGASVYLPALSGALGPLAEELGLLVDGADHRSMGGEVYARMIPLGGKDRPPPPAWVMWAAGRLMPPLRRRARSARAFLASGAGEAFLDRWDAEWREAFRTETAQLKAVDLATLDDHGLLAHLDRLQELLARGEEVHFRLHAPYALALHELTATSRDLLGWEPTETLCLLTGTSTASSEPGRELAALAARFAAHPAASDTLEEPGDGFLTRLREAAPETATAFEEYLDRYGHRTVSYDPGDPTLFERPALFAALLRDMIRASTDHTVAGAEDQREAALTRAQAALAGRSDPDRRRFETALDRARRAYGPREDNIFWVDNQPCALIRYAAVEIGRRLTGRGALAAPADAVYLTQAELRRALSRSDKDDLRTLVARRKAERAWVLAHPGPPTHGPDPGTPDLSPLPGALRTVNVALFELQGLMFSAGTAQPDGAQLCGVPASPGSYTGPARVVRNEAEFTKLRAGDVLVCPITSPPWSVLFLQAGAVVTDTGGILSHTAVIAREYGLPAVLATGVATRRLGDGDVVTVNGTAGTVTMLTPDPAGPGR